MSSNQLAQLAAVLERSAVSPRMTTFDDRLAKQKLIVFLQAMGFNFGYQFSWYVRGPYSSGLAADLFELENRRIRSAPLRPAIQAAIDRLVLSLKDNGLAGLSAPAKMELMGSVAFRRQQGETDEEVIQSLARLKPQFTKEQVIAATRLARQLQT